MHLDVEAPVAYLDEQVYAFKRRMTGELLFVVRGRFTRSEAEGAVDGYVGGT